MRQSGRMAVAIALGAGVLALAGCGEDFAEADVEAGKQTFATACASCHTLADSGRPPSNIGPNLDDAFRASRQVGMDESQFAGVVHRWIREAQPPMPRDIVVGEDALNVSAYIAAVAGTSEESSVRAANPTPEIPRESRQDQAD